MSTPFQNRIVGTIIVAAVLVVFLPDVLDGNKKSYQADFEAIPKAPTFSGETKTPTFPANLLKVKTETKLIDEQPQDDVVTNQLSVIDLEKKYEVTPAVKSTPIKETALTQVKQLKTLPEKSILKEAWVIQLGSFKHQQNVKELLAKLKRNGYTAFTKPIKTKHGNLTKVFIGPELIKSSLTNKISVLKKLTNVQGKIARFYPEKG